MLESKLNKLCHEVVRDSRGMFDVASYSNVDIILKYTRAFMRVRGDKKLIIEKVINPVDYLRDTFNDNEA
jgi:hypothetical protein